MKSISLFSGMGGDSVGMEAAGFDVIAFNEFDKAAINTHNVNFPSSTLIEDPSQTKVKDRTNIQVIPDSIFQPYAGEIDLIFAGHPCQGFSQGVSINCFNYLIIISNHYPIYFKD